MEFTYEKSNELYDISAGVTPNIGNYTGPETLIINVDENGFITETGREVELLATNPNHIILMDILNGSEGFVAKDNALSTTDAIGPFINHINYESYPTNVEYNVAECSIDVDGIVTYVHSTYALTNDDIINNATVALREFEANYDRTPSTSMKAMYAKLIAICEWIVYEWKNTTFASHKIVIPTLETIDTFNDVVVTV